jgi:uncharacterized protein (TIGR03067 family)
MRITAFLLLAILPALAAGCGKSQSTPGTPSGETGSASDMERLQGMWAVVSFEGDEDDQPPPEKLKAIRFIFEGDKLKIANEGPEPQISSFTLDTGSNPKGITLTRLDKDGKPHRRFAEKGEGEIDRMEVIYKFDGDHLVMALSEGSGAHGAPRPTEFKPKEGRKPSPPTKGTAHVPGTPDIFVVTFKKTTEPAPSRPAGSFPTAAGATKKK